MSLITKHSSAEHSKAQHSTAVDFVSYRKAQHSIVRQSRAEQSRAEQSTAANFVRYYKVEQGREWQLILCLITMHGRAESSS